MAYTSVPTKITTNTLSTIDWNSILKPNLDFLNERRDSVAFDKLGASTAVAANNTSWVEIDSGFQVNFTPSSSIVFVEMRLALTAFSSADMCLVDLDVNGTRYWTGASGFAEGTIPVVMTSHIGSASPYLQYYFGTAILYGLTPDTSYTIKPVTKSVTATSNTFTFNAESTIKALY